MKKIRCAICTRKSSEECLEQEFNSLDAQRESCVAYVASQKREDWILLPEHYDDGGISGGTLERPALQTLLSAIDAGRVDQIIVYKIDRPTRSLADFSKIVDRLEAAGTSFVSVTQSFNTATSMGWLTLNMLLSFAQFEREVTAERIRDKIAASKRKGLWMDGNVPLGYDPDGRTLKINQSEAKTIRTLYDLYEQHGTVRAVKEQAEGLNLRTRIRETKSGKISGGGTFDRGHIHHILTNPIYAGRILHGDKVYDGQHAAIIQPVRLDETQARLQDGAARARQKKGTVQSSLLCGKIFDETGDRPTPSHSKTRKGVRLRYYISHRLVARSGEANLDGWHLPAEELETRAVGLVKSMLSETGFAARINPGARAGETKQLYTRLLGVLDTLKADELLQMIKRVDVTPGGLKVSLDDNYIAKMLEIASEDIVPEVLTKSVTLQLRKRGVETRLVIANTLTGIDERLITNIANAHHWFGQIKSGMTFAEISRIDGTSKRRIQQMIDLAFLAPDIIRDVLEVKQSLGFTSDWCLRHKLPPDWKEQRELIATL